MNVHTSAHWEHIHRDCRIFLLSSILVWETPCIQITKSSRMSDLQTIVGRGYIIYGHGMISATHGIVHCDVTMGTCTVMYTPSTV